MRIAWLGVVVLAAAGCTTYKVLTESDADERAGTIELSYEYRRFESPQVDERGGLATARERCLGWGYPNAQRGGERNACVDGTKDDCKKWRVTREYRCVKAK
jgi:YecR-like lipoprotein